MLWRKMWRELWENRAPYAASIVVVAIGLLVFTSMSMVYDNLQSAQERFYRDYRFADVFARVTGMPYSEISRLAAMEGIADVEGRLVKDVRVLFPGRSENVYLRLVSLQPARANPVNGVKLLEGSPLAAKSREIWVSPDFLKANGLRLGEEIPVLIEGKKIDLKVTGTAQSPEFVYAMRTAQDMLPDARTFGVAYVSWDVTQSLFREQGQVNDVVFTIAPGGSYRDVEEPLKSRLKPYGLESIFPAKDQVSNIILTQEMVGLRSTATTLPVYFLIVAAVILYIQLKRMVEQQRGQIGTLKAFGYSGRDVVWHYLSYALVIGFFGGVIGGLAGIWLSFSFTRMYQTFFNLPDLTSRFSLGYLVLGIALSSGFSLLAGYQGSKGALKLQPAEAMRPPAPPTGKRTALERLSWFWGSLTVQGKMAVRNVFRNRSRSLVTLVGLSFAFSIMGMTWYFKDISGVLIGDQFTRVETYDAKMTFTAPVLREKADRELVRLPQVKRVEPLLEVPVTLKYKWHKKDAVVIGLAPDSRMYNILNNDGRKVSPPASGVLLSNRLAEQLGVTTGSRVTLDSVWAREDGLTLEVAGVIPQYLGVNAYMDQRELDSLLKQRGMATSVILAMDRVDIPVLKEKFRTSSIIATMDDKLSVIDRYNQMMESYSYMTWVLALFGVIVGFAVIYNAGMVSFSERKRELATLRVLGMTPREVLEVLTFEQWFISFFAMLIGIPGTIIVLRGMAQSMNNDIYSIPVKVSPSLFIFAALGVSLAIWLAQRMQSRKINTLVLADVLKERD